MSISGPVGATICYKINATPGAATPGTCDGGSTTYSTAFSVSVSETVYALATEAGFTNSSITSAGFTIVIGPTGGSSTSGAVTTGPTTKAELIDLTATSLSGLTPNGMTVKEEKIKKQMRLLIALVVCLSASLYSQALLPVADLTATIAGGLPSASANTNKHLLVIDGISGSDCSVGGGSAKALSASNGTSWVALGGGTVTSVATSCGAFGGTITTNGTILIENLVNPQTGTSYTINVTDCQKLVTFTNSSAVAVLLPTAGGTFYTGFKFAAGLWGGNGYDHARIWDYWRSINVSSDDRTGL